MRGVRALVFDVFGTVVDWRGGVAREADAFLERFGARERDGARFADRWRAQYQPAMEPVRRGQRPFVVLDVLNRETLVAVLEATGVDVRDVPEEALGELSRAWHRLDPWPDAVEGLRRLKRDFVLGTLSNGNVALMVNMARRAGLPWDAILGAELVRTYKPEPAVYLGAAESLGLRPDQVCLVAAHNDDLAAARRCGLRTAFVPRPTEHGPDQTTDLEAAQDWEVAAPDLVALAERLGC
jgi:2-haloacid dehalogenase